MNLRTYTLSVSLAAIVGLLLTVAPLVRNTLEYRSPSPAITEPHELSSLEAFVAAKSRNANEVTLMHINRNGWYVRYGGDQWQAMYDAAKAQHAEALQQQVESIRRRAARNAIAYGTLCTLCIVLLIVHLLWARRVLARINTGRAKVCQEGSRVGLFKQMLKDKQEVKKKSTCPELTPKDIPLPPAIKQGLSEIARTFIEEGRTDFDKLVGEFEELLGEELFDAVADYLPAIVAAEEQRA